MKIYPQDEWYHAADYGIVGLSQNSGSLEGTDDVVEALYGPPVSSDRVPATWSYI